MLAELILIAELLERSGGVSPAAQQPKPIAKKITISVVPLTYEQYKDIPTGEKKLGRPGLRPKGL